MKFRDVSLHEKWVWATSSEIAALLFFYIFNKLELFLFFYKFYVNILDVIQMSTIHELTVNKKNIGKHDAFGPSKRSESFNQGPTLIYYSTRTLTIANSAKNLPKIKPSLLTHDTV